MNLEAFQKKVGKANNESFNMTILYLPQFMGMAMGLPETDTRLDLNLSITKEFEKKYFNKCLSMTSNPLTLMTVSA
ncbi:MAG: hypothetical protein KAR45_18990, partial [Desulfobacteraceae bacterium]|nr:hypothetical protein [Desulfobacteraceae bacterium]